MADNSKQLLVVSTNERDRSDWIEKWKTDDRTARPWSKDEVSEYFTGQILRNTFPKTNGVTSSACSIVWRLVRHEMGATVYGVDLAENAARAFFQASKLGFVEENVYGQRVMKKFQTADNRMNFVVGDLLALDKNVFGDQLLLFDMVLDRGALVAINPSERDNYVQLLKSLLAPNARLLMITVRYDETKYGGPPHSIRFDKLRQLFPSPEYSVKPLESEDIFRPFMKEHWNVDEVYEDPHLICRNISPIREDAILGADGWLDRWDAGKTGWFLDQPHRFLVANYEKVLQKLSKTELKVFVPLCGNSVDVKWLYDKGATIFGTEMSSVAVKQLFTSNDIKFTISTQFGTQEAKSLDGRLRIYAGDMFEIYEDFFSQHFDLIWDRGSLVAIDVEMQNKYTTWMHQLLSKDTVMLLALFDYDETQWGGPPHYISRERLNELYKPEKYNVELLEKHNSLTPTRAENWNTDYCTEDAYWITLKTDASKVNACFVLVSLKKVLGL